MLINNIINPGFGCKNPVQSLILIIKIINLRSVVFSWRLKVIFELNSTKLVFFVAESWTKRGWGRTRYFGYFSKCILAGFLAGFGYF